MPTQLGIGQIYHQKKWNFNAYPTICRLKQYEKNLVRNAQKKLCTLVDSLQKKKKLMSLLIRF